MLESNESINKLDVIKNNNVKRRLIKEFNIIKNKFGENIYILDVHLNDNNLNDEYRRFDYSIIIYDYDKNRNYEIFIKNAYPFSPPKLILNGRPYNYYLKNSTNAFRDILYKFTRFRCFCCETILCPDNWSPSFTILDIIKEVNRFHDVCLEFAYRTLVDIIKRKYLINDINLIQWII
jgi:ubiquitin-protein ligase